ncbi:MAG: AI-2E family transporter [Clostridium sp.]
MFKFDKINMKWVWTLVTTFVIIQLILNLNSITSGISKILSMLSPFIVGLIIAYILNPLVNLIENKLKLKRGLSLLLIYGVFIFLSSLLIVLVLPVLIESIVHLVSNIPDYSKDLEAWLLSFEYDKFGQVMEQFTEQIVKIIPKLTSIFGLLINNLVNTTISVTSFLINFVFSVIISFYLLSDKEGFMAYGKKISYVLLKKKRGDLFRDVLITFHENVGTYIVAKLIDSFFVGLVSYLGLMLIGSEYALLLGIFCGITNLIPYFGPLLGMIPVGIINLFFNYKIAIACIIFLLIVQQIEGNIIEPKFVGGRLGLNPLLTLLAVTLGGGLFGIVGMVVSVPVIAVIKIFMDKLIQKYSYRETIE